MLLHGISVVEIHSQSFLIKTFILLGENARPKFVSVPFFKHLYKKIVNKKSLKII